MDENSLIQDKNADIISGDETTKINLDLLEAQLKKKKWDIKYNRIMCSKNRIRYLIKCKLFINLLCILFTYNR